MTWSQTCEIRNTWFMSHGNRINSCAHQPEFCFWSVCIVYKPLIPPFFTITFLKRMWFFSFRSKYVHEISLKWWNQKVFFCSLWPLKQRGAINILKSIMVMNLVKITFIYYVDTKIVPLQPTLLIPSIEIVQTRIILLHVHPQVVYCNNVNFDQ